MLIKLSDHLYVAEDEISKIELNSYRTSISVIMKNGQRYSHDIGYNKSPFIAINELVQQINGDMK